MEQQEISEMMKQSSDEAVLLAEREFDITLNGGPESIRLVDEIIAQYAISHQASELSDKHIFTLCNLFGSYIGEVFIASTGGEWIYDDSDKDAPFVCISFSEKTFAFPGIVYQKLVNDNAISVNRYYELAVEGVTQ